MSDSADPNTVNLGVPLSSYVTSSHAWSMNFREPNRPNSCGNPKCQECNEAKRRGIYIEQHN